MIVPDDPAILDAERRGLAALDAAPEALAVLALVRLAEYVMAPELAISVTGS